MKKGVGLRVVIVLALACLAGLSPDATSHQRAVMRGDALQQAGRHVEALAAFDEALRDRPRAGSPWLAAARSAMAIKRPELAVRWYGRAYEQAPGDSGLLVEWGRAYADLGDNNRAADMWGMALRQEPDNPEARYQKALNYLRRGEFDLAATHFADALQAGLSDGEAQDSHYRLGLLLADTGPDGLTHLRAAIRGPLRTVASRAQTVLGAIELAGPRGLSTRTVLGASLATLEDWPLAERALLRAVDQNPGDIQALVYLGLTLDRLVQTDAAGERLRQALALAPDDVTALFLWGKHLAGQGNHRAARYAFERVLDLDPSNAAAAAEIARTYQAVGRYPEAEEWLDGATARTPDRVDFFLMKAEFECETAFNPTKAIEAARQALALEPGNALALDFLGAALYQSGQSAEAEKAWRQAIGVEPDLVSAHYHLGELYQRQKRFEPARDEYVRVLDLGAGTASARMAELALRDMGNHPLSELEVLR